MTISIIFSHLILSLSLLVGQVNYESDLQRDIFDNHCLVCHVSVNGSGALELDSYEYLMQGDSNNGPVVVPFNADSSLLYRVLLRDSVIVPNEPICCRMPKNAPPLSTAQIEKIYNWINEGAVGPNVGIEYEYLDKFSLISVYPNPFNNKINISLMVNQPGLKNIIIFDILGKRVKTITRKKYGFGMDLVFWNGNDDFNRPVSGGLYLIGFEVDNKIEGLKKVLYLK